MPGIRWTEEEYEAYLAQLAENRRAKEQRRAPRPAYPPVSAADVEPTKRAAAKKKNVGKALHPRVRIKVHSKRRRRVDPDGVSAKAAIDGLVRGGLLADDSPEEIAEVVYTQEKSETEETIIEVEEIIE